MSRAGADQPGTAAPPRDPWTIRVVLSLYPARWRARYGEEFASLLLDTVTAATRPARARLLANAASGALDAHLSRLGGSRMPDRLHGPVTAVTWSAIAFAIGVGGFAKLREGSQFSAAARDHASVAASLGVLRGAAAAAGVALIAAVAPLIWSVLRQIAVTRRGDLIRPLAVPPAAVALWIAVVLAITHSHSHPPVHSAANIAVAALVLALGAAAVAACGWSATTVLRRADLPPQLLRPQVILMAALSACMALATGADLAWGLALRSADTALFHSGGGFLATPMPPSWAANLALLAAATTVTASATVRAARQRRACPPQITAV